MDLEAIQRGAPGLGPTLARGGLSVLACGFALGHGARMACYAWGLRTPERLPVPVISVGNITAGGTGKTPMVAWLIERLRDAGRTPGVLARGYGPTVVARADGGPLNDEGAELLARFGAMLPQVQRADRIEGFERLAARHPVVDVVLLDDGFQHVQVARDLDIVLVDAQRPLGYGYRLPRGLLRESPRALARADVVVITRGGGLTPAARAALALRLGAFTEAPILASEVRPTRLRDAHGATSPRELDGARVIAVAGTGHPEAFVGTLHDLGASVLRCVTPGDHRALAPGALEALCVEARQEGARVVMTGKDAAKLAALPEEVAVLEIEVAFLDGEDVLLDRLRAVCSKVRAASSSAMPACPADTAPSRS